MKHFLVLPITVAILLISACTPNEPSDPNDAADPTPVREENPTDTQPDVEPRETHNVSYRGVVKPAGISIYQQGSHRLVLSDDRFILLESDDVDLNGYVGEEAEVFGSVRPTVEEGGMIMRVEKISLVNEEEETEEESEEGEEFDDTEEKETEEDVEGQDEEEVADADTEEVVEEEEVLFEREMDDSDEEDILEESDADVEDISAGSVSEELVSKMEGENYSAERWTQEYRTGHIGFSIPVHKNWWYKSFGATSSHLWHVELSAEEVENIGDGAIVVRLVDGSIDATGASDGDVRTVDAKAIGYRAWNDDSHFEVIADARLVEPVSFITSGLEPIEE